MNINSTRGRAIALAAISASLMFGSVSSAYADMLTRQLQVGMSGADVSSLQAFLALDTSIYPQGLVTGYFGPLTFAAVSNFQTRNGISAVGRVGPITLAAINSLMGSAGGSSDTAAPIIWNIRITSATSTAVVRWATSEPSAGIVYYSLVPLVLTDGLKDVTVSGNTAVTDSLQRSSQDVTIVNLQANTTYNFVIYARDASGNVQVTWPSTFRTN